MATIGSTLASAAAYLAVWSMALGAAPGVAWSQPKSIAASEKTVAEIIVTAEKRVAELTVTAPVKCAEIDPFHMRMGNRPKVVSAFPGNGDVVRPGLLVMRVTFDQPMACQGRFYPIPRIADPCPEPYPSMLLSPDRRTIREVCMVAPDTHFRVKLTRNFVATDTPTKSTWPFMSIRNSPAEAYEIDFSTSAGAAIGDVCEAMAQDKATFASIVDCG